MKKIIFSLFFGIIFSAHTVQAQDTDTKHVKGFIGGEITGALVKISYPYDLIFKDTYATFALSTGVKIDRISLSVFIQNSSEEEGFVKTSFKAYGADIGWYTSIAKNFDLIVGLGVGRYDFEAEHIGNENHIGLRSNLGAEFKISENFSLTTNYRYIPLIGKETDIVKRINEFALGMKFYF